MRSKTKTKSVVSKLDGKLTSNDQETPNTLNDYFSTIFEIEPDEPCQNLKIDPVFNN